MLNFSNETASVLTRFGFPFSECKKTLKDNGVMLSAIEHSELEQLLTIPEMEFERLFHDWQEWWNKYISSEGACFQEAITPTPMLVPTPESTRSWHHRFSLDIC
jgi:hypothetical protein